ncbi:hypothetical protein ACFPRL_36210 [Pseudoclavibacter helvolus]
MAEVSSCAHSCLSTAATRPRWQYSAARVRFFAQVQKPSNSSWCPVKELPLSLGAASVTSSIPEALFRADTRLQLAPQAHPTLERSPTTFAL